MSSQYKYEEFVWTPTLGHNAVAGKDMLATMRIEWWSECQSSIRMDLQKWLDEGWEPVTSIGPEAWEVVPTRVPVCSYWTPLTWILWLIFLIPSCGLLLLALFQTDTVYKPFAFRVQMRAQVKPGLSTGATRSKTLEHRISHPQVRPRSSPTAPAKMSPGTQMFTGEQMKASPASQQRGSVSQLFVLILVVGIPLSIFGIYSFVNKARTPVLLSTVQPLPAFPPTAQPKPASQPSENNFEVFGNQSWQNTEVVVQAGDTLTIQYVSGKWSPYSGSYFDGEGLGSQGRPFAENNEVQGVTHAALVGRIGDSTPFYVGNKYTQTVGQSGVIFLRINDNVLGDNSGSIIVNINVSPSPTFTPKPATSQPNSCIPPPGGLISWWPSDGNANDIIGSNNGALVRGATFTGGKVGQAFSFDGIDDIVLASATGLPTGAAPRTVAFWSKISPSDDTTTSFTYSTDASGKGFSVFPSHGENGGKLTFSGHGTAYDVFAPTDLRDGLYHHVAVTYDGAIVTVYADGVPVASGSLDLDTGISAGTSIGGRSYGGGGEYLTGEVDEVAIWNRALSASEIQAMFSAGSAGMCKTK